MERLWSLLLVTLALVVLVPGGAIAADPGGCQAIERAAGTCNVSAGIRDDGVTIGVDVTVPGSGGQGGGPASEPSNRVCDGVGTVEVCRDTYDAIAAVTLSDIAHFRPTPGRNLMEPNGWMIVGLPTNFYAQSNAHVVTGELRGATAWVRFTPIGYRWWYGDGSTRYSTTKGNTWSALGLSEFARTPNSHVYGAPGTYYIDLSIVFRAEYRYAGDDFYPIAGTLTIPANRLVAVAGSATTVLVEDDCTRNPGGPGC